MRSHPLNALGIALCITSAAPSRADVTDFLAVQTSYSFEDPQNLVRLTWNQTSSNAGGVDILLDGQQVTNVAGAIGANSVSLPVETTGVHGFTARVGGSVLGEASHNVLEEQPVGDALNLACNQAPSDEDCEITVIFSNPGPPGDAYSITLDGQTIAEASGVPGPKSVNVSITSPGEHCVTVTGVIELPDGMYISDPMETCCQVTCGIAPGSSFIRGICNGAGAKPDISSAIFGLKFLFSGGPSPPCREACNANGDASFDLSDMIHVLTYLFQGGPPPPTWVDANADGEPDPTCESAPLEKCETSLASCAG